MTKVLRSPICSVLGHVDHGKTSLLDSVRKSSITSREAGGITQHIGASEVPLEVVRAVCGSMLDKLKVTFTLPGLLFIDTPGHEAFANLRRRGGSIADIAVLVIDVNQGIQNQTIEAIEILKEYKVPFVVAATKIDAISGWIANKGSTFSDSFPKQRMDVQQLLDQKIYELIGQLYEYGFSAERFDRVSDFTKQILIIPLSSRTGEGIQELLMYLAGLAQRFLDKKLELDVGSLGKATVLEVREERGLGKTLDVILYSGKVELGDEIVFSSQTGVVSSKIKALLKPKPLEEIRDPREKFLPVKVVYAASGLKIACEGADAAVAGSSLFVVSQESKPAAIDELLKEFKEIVFEGQNDGVIVKADTLGSLEAISKLFSLDKIPIRSASIGSISKKDVLECKSVGEKDLFLGVIFAFNVVVDYETSSFASANGVKIFEEKIIYNLIEGYKKWRDEESAKEKKEAFSRMPLPAKIVILENSIFRASNPCVVGVEVLIGTIKKDVALVDEKGKLIGILKSIQVDKNSVDSASKGQKVAISMDEPTAGRQVFEKMQLFVDLPKDVIKSLEEKYLQALSEEERGLLNEMKRRKGLSSF